MKFSQFRHLHELIRKSIHPDVAMPQLSILYLVYEQGTVAQGEISKILSMPQGTVSRNVKKLSSYLVKNSKGDFVEGGYGLVRVTYDNPYDSRVAMVRLSDKGRRVMGKIQEVLNRSTNENRITSSIRGGSSSVHTN